jgi:hypothetical protein
VLTPTVGHEPPEAPATRRIQRRAPAAAAGQLRLDYDATITRRLRADTQKFELEGGTVTSEKNPDLKRGRNLWVTAILPASQDILGIQ